METKKSAVAPKTKYVYQPVTVPHELAALGYPKAVTEILFRRGIDTPEKVDEFMNGTIEDVLKGIESVDSEKAVKLIMAAKEIVVYRDYDCDGISAASIVIECLTALGKTVREYANDRSVDGYGMCVNGINKIKDLYPDADTILTVDNGVAAFDGANRAKELGYTLIITDHHEEMDELPVCDALIDLKCRRESADFRDLCGAGIALRLMAAVYEKAGADPAVVEGCIDIAALATAADVVPIIGQNRTILKYGMKKMNAKNRPFFRYVCEQTRLGKIGEYEIGFIIAPMINAISRMGEDTSIGVKLLIAKYPKDPKEMKGFEMDMKVEIEHINDLNQSRKNLTKAGLAVVRENLDVRSVVFAMGDVSDGVIGIVAGRLKEEFNRPAFVFSADGKASARGVDGFSLKSALDRVPKELLEGYGGHEKAAGLKVKPENIEAFKDAFTAITDAELEVKDPEKIIEYKMSGDELTKKFITDLEVLAPFGEGFRRPIIELDEPAVMVKKIGADQQHLRFATDRGFTVLHWNAAEDFTGDLPEVFYGYPSMNYWNGNTYRQFVCAD